MKWLLRIPKYGPPSSSSREFLRSSFRFHYRDPTLLSAVIQSVHSSFKMKFKDRLAWIDAASAVAVLLDDLNFISNEHASKG